MVSVTRTSHSDSSCAPAAGEKELTVREVIERLDRIEATLTQLVEQRRVKDFYSTAEAAAILGKAEFTVREWMRLGRVRGQKQATGRGKSKEWVLSHSELVRIQNEGLLAQPK
jgi:DNA-directed RNA polymerase specialized sigma24 family protein